MWHQQPENRERAIEHDRTLPPTAFLELLQSSQWFRRDAKYLLSKASIATNETVPQPHSNEQVNHAQR